MTLFTTLLVLLVERLFKLGEHWQFDHRLETFSPGQTLLNGAYARDDDHRNGGHIPVAASARWTAV